MPGTKGADVLQGGKKEKFASSFACMKPVLSKEKIPPGKRGRKKISNVLPCKLQRILGKRLPSGKRKSPGRESSGLLT